MTTPGRSVALLLAFGVLFSVGTVPVAADGDDPMGCINLLLARYSPGIVFDASLGVDAVGITVATDQPDSGYQAAIVIVPTVCALQAIVPLEDIDERLTNLQKDQASSSPVSGPPALP